MLNCEGVFCSAAPKFTVRVRQPEGQPAREEHGSCGRHLNQVLGWLSAQARKSSPGRPVSFFVTELPEFGDEL